MSRSNISNTKVSAWSHFQTSRTGWKYETLLKTLKKRLKSYSFKTYDTRVLYYQEDVGPGKKVCLSNYKFTIDKLCLSIHNTQVV